ncbi:HAMP domain-containing histidine kinase [Antarcticibacterium flavum]|uniref:histidine kinase n=1 Tax=Antarcticibacterium flavum TaxID=2058175 RepID=A0A5B7X3D8_9FLAO|nr:MULTISPECIES: HAMP domain-containing sensor histidine kinase [Antarcticibacterium]MCM4159520.1 two-component sensor histidine kinase [Antarcticibacterium sp. W02-3]QCY69849.1 HAMP domain-containing histidine kinase [Antarcticibacterium flavum]
MNFTDERNLARWFIIISSLFIVALILWNTSIFFERLKEDERDKMEIWASAQAFLAETDNESEIALTLQVLNSNTTIPTIWVDEKGEIIDGLNLPEGVNRNEDELKNYLNRLEKENEPIEMYLGQDQVHRIYYGDSPLLTKIKYYPIGLLLIIFLFIGVVYFFYTTTKSSEQNKLWAGMAKETAHQIGTPLSSLIGWTEILKTENVDQSYITEMEKDVDRLRTITERFSKIGSSPLLSKTELVQATRESFEYLKLRSSDLIEFKLTTPYTPIYVSLNESLYSWTIENLVKNAVDAMRGKGKLSIEIKQDNTWVYVYIKDTGKGIPKSKYRTVFEPGYTSKKRGWGLGLSLAKRIIEQYHKGRIQVQHSELNKGTTFQIALRKLPPES